MKGMTKDWVMKMFLMSEDQQLRFLAVHCSNGSQATPPRNVTILIASSSYMNFFIPCRRVVGYPMGDRELRDRILTTTHYYRNYLQRILGTDHGCMGDHQNSGMNSHFYLYLQY